jgi:large subunit GTPase 1
MKRGGKRVGATSLGRSIQRSKVKERRRRKVENGGGMEGGRLGGVKYGGIHTTDVVDDRPNMQSCLHRNDLEELLEVAELAQREFIAERENAVILENKSFVQRPLDAPSVDQRRHESLHRSLVRIPRRPRWTREMSAEQLDAQENEAFLKWRRSLVDVEQDEQVMLTPFEKNLQVWRQLWRVVERSQLLVQIVDARNPLLFYCEDLETYAREVHGERCPVLLLVNKSDFLTATQRRHWARYFESRGIRFAFWSAALAEQLIADAAAAERDALNQAILDNDRELNADLRRRIAADIDAGKSLSSTAAASAQQSNNAATGTGTGDLYVDADDNDDDVKRDNERAGDIRLLGKDELVALLRSLAADDFDGKVLNIGMIGYPNVGKSSTINVLYGEKKAAVAATPGKTKHFQTLFLADDLCLCDCPGLVFPSFTTTKASMVCNGLVPIDQLRDVQAPVSIIARNIPRQTLELMYGIKLVRPADHEDQTRPPTSKELLEAYGYIRGFMTAHGRPDESRAARLILKDYINGKLVFCYPPPTYRGLADDDNDEQDNDDGGGELLTVEEHHKRALQFNVHGVLNKTIMRKLEDAKNAVASSSTSSPTYSEPTYDPAAEHVGGFLSENVTMTGFAKGRKKYQDQQFTRVTWTHKTTRQQRRAEKFERKRQMAEQSQSKH